jgi:phosphomannomutase
MKRLFLFDMDGTLTPARKKMSYDVLSVLEELQRVGWEIGIISGSDMNYIEQQCYLLFDLTPIDVTKIHFLPCNGTKYYKSFKKVWEYDMVSKLSSQIVKSIMRQLLIYQNTIFTTHPDMPLTGNFFQMRGSVLNWCPIGRNASQEQRNNWSILDKKYSIRKNYINAFRTVFDQKLLTIKLGGETSFDIYPDGWNKTFPINKDPFLDYNQIYFAGDRCFKSGNDEELYNLLKLKDNCKSFQVNNPKETINIIKETLGES